MGLMEPVGTGPPVAAIWGDIPLGEMLDLILAELGMPLILWGITPPRNLLPIPICKQHHSHYITLPMLRSSLNYSYLISI